MHSSAPSCLPMNPEGSLGRLQVFPALMVNPLPSRSGESGCIKSSSRAPLDRDLQSSMPPYVAQTAEYWLSGQGAGPCWRSKDPWTAEYHARIAQCLGIWAERGDPEAQYYMARCLQRGFAVACDAAQAARLFRRAAAQGEPRAQNAIGRCFECGLGVMGDDCAAAECYRMAAAQGDPEGEFNMGRCFEHGIGTRRDLAQAVVYYGRAKAKGHTSAALREGILVQSGIKRVSTDGEAGAPNGPKVTRYAGWFDRSDGEVIVRPTVVVIPGGAFRGCGWLNVINFEAEGCVGMIGEYGFYGTALRSVDIPGSVEVVGDASFANCALLASVRFDSHGKLRVIGEDAFWRTDVRSAGIPQSVRIVRDWAFAWCRRLRSVTLPDSEVKIRENTFAFTPYARSRATSSFLPRSRSGQELRELKARFDRLMDPAVDGCCAVFVSKALELSEAKRHEDAFRMYLRAMSGLGLSERSGLLRVLIDRAMEVFAALPEISGQVIDRWRGFFDWARLRVMCPVARAAAFELRSLERETEDEEIAAPLRRKAMFLDLLGEFWLGDPDVPRGIKVTVDRLSTKEWKLKKQ